VDHRSSFEILGLALEICLIDLLLSGDNAVVIALVCRGLPPPLWRKVVWLGTVAAVGLRVALTASAALILDLPYVKLVGAVLLVAIAIRLLVEDPPSRAELDSAQQQPHDLWKAITTIIVADTVMSLDNVVAVAAASHGSLLLLTFGLLLSIPILIFGSVMVARVLDRYPIVIQAGGALLGWVAGATAVSDPAIVSRIESHWFGLAAVAPPLVAVYVLIHGRLARRQRLRAGTAPDVKRR
jgi:YjbE family integral membrane protein